MSCISLLIYLLVAALCGAIGASIAGFSSRGCITNLVVGLAGAVIGNWLSLELRLPRGFTLQGIPILWAIIGSALLIFILTLITGRNQRRRR